MENEEMFEVNAFSEPQEWWFGNDYTPIDGLDLGGSFVLNVASKSNLSRWLCGACKRGILITKEEGEDGPISQKRFKPAPFVKGQV